MASSRERREQVSRGLRTAVEEAKAYRLDGEVCMDPEGRRVLDPQLLVDLLAQLEKALLDGLSQPEGISYYQERLQLIERYVGRIS